MSRRIAIVSVVGLVLSMAAAVGAPAQARSPFSPGAAGLGDPYFPLDGNGGYDVVHNDLDLTYDPATDVLVSTATIDATATQGLSRFDLDLIGLTVRSVTVAGAPARWTRDGQELVVTPRQGIPKGQSFRVVVRYDGSPVELQDFGGAAGFVRTPDGVSVTGQPHGAATWFPANDHPRDRASYTFHIRVPAGLQAIANGALVSNRTRNGWTTWVWDAKAPMVSYLATMTIGHLAITSYTQGGVRYWDAVAQRFLDDKVPPVAPYAGSTFLYSQQYDGAASYKRLTRTLTVPPGGATLSFRVSRDTERGWDHLFVESHTVGLDDWTTLPDDNGHTSQDVGTCPFFTGAHPFLAHYLTARVDTTDPANPIDTCDPTGTTGSWNAADGTGSGWEAWQVTLPNATAAPKQVEVSISYESDESVQGQGVSLDDVVYSAGAGSTSFEPDADPLDGWVVAPAPDGSPDNPNSWATASSVAAIPGPGVGMRKSLNRLPEILAFEASMFGRYPFTTAGGVIPDVQTGFALETQTRPTYSSLFFLFSPDNTSDWVVVHENAHQWYGDSLSVNSWKDIWLNEGFATYAEWLWGEREGYDSPAAEFDYLASFPADDPMWTGAMGDPGVDRLFDSSLVYQRGAMTLQALRMKVGDTAFFQILRTWATVNAGRPVSTEQFIELAERISHKRLERFFDEWLSAGRPASLPAPPAPPAPAALRSASTAGVATASTTRMLTPREKVAITAAALARAGRR
ncbi:MAG: M1 family metallopeptidase [Candidatus Nanopelagicales bacterium]